jgi:hypothetical protein
MMQGVLTEVEALPVEEQGALLGMALGGASVTAADRLAGPAGARCRTALAALAGLPEAARANELAGLRAAVGSPVPGGLGLVHPGWLRQALEDEALALLRVATAGLGEEVTRVADEVANGRGESLGSPVEVSVLGAAREDLRRALFCELAAMPGKAVRDAWPDATSLCDPRPPTGLSTIDRIELYGCQWLGMALHGAPSEVVARAAAGVGSRFAEFVIKGSRSALGPGPDYDKGEPFRAEARALVAAVSADDVAEYGAALAIGMRKVAQWLVKEGDGSLKAVAQRLPLAMGRSLLACAPVPTLFEDAD